MSAHMGAHFLSRDKMIKSEGGKREVEYESRTAANFLT